MSNGEWIKTFWFVQFGYRAGDVFWFAFFRPRLPSSWDWNPLTWVSSDVQELRDNKRDIKNNLYDKRGWIRTKHGNPNYREFWRWQLCIGKKIFGNWFALRCAIGGENARSVSFYFNLLWVQLFVTVNNILPKKWAMGWRSEHPYRFEDNGGREFGIGLHENHLSIRFFTSAHCSGRGTFRQYGWYKSWFIDETIFGRKSYEQVNPAKFEHEPIEFPEGTYHLTGTLSQDTWKYKRWPWWPLVAVVPRAHCEVDEKSGIPVPGKGENSWDCGDDATHGMTCPAKNLDELKASIRESVYSDRKRHGGGPEMYLKRKVSQ